MSVRMLIVLEHTTQPAVKNRANEKTVIECSKLVLL